MSTVAGKPLTGLKVLDFTHVLAGPYCTMLLGDMGAEVLKIEPPQGDSLRHQGPPFHHGQGISFLAANRNKRSLVLDLRTESGKALAHELASTADVIVENFRSGVMARFGLDYATLQTVNPRLVYCSLSGFGSTGPYANKGAFDLTIQAIGGYMSITGEQGGSPVKLGTSAFDLIAGMNAVIAIQAALLQREHTGHGQQVETSLFESEIAFLTNAALHYLLTGRDPEKWGSEHPEAVPYKAFQTSDGWVVIAAGLQQIYPRFVETLGRSDLATDARFATPEARQTNRKALYKVLDALIATRNTADMMEQLEAAEIPASRVNKVSEVMADPQAQHRKMVHRLTHPEYGDVEVLGSAFKFANGEITSGWSAPPLLGEGGAQALREWLALTDTELTTHAQAGAFGKNKFHSGQHTGSPGD